MTKTSRKILFSLGTIGVIAAPIATVISCGAKSSGFARLNIKAIKVAGAPGAMNSLYKGDITVAGTWSDARVFLKNGQKNAIHAVGVVKSRIANGGIQVRGNMDGNDQKAIQTLFKNLIQLANKQKKASGASGSDDLLFTNEKGKLKTLFEVYSHTDYKILDKNTKISVLDKGKLKEVSAMGGNEITTTVDTTKTKLFSKASAPTSITATTNLGSSYNLKSGKQLRIKFIPSNDPTDVSAVTSKLQKYLNKIGVNATIDTSTDYDSGAAALENGQVDIAFLPAGAWSAGARNSNFILQAARPVQIATTNISGATANLATSKINSEILAVKLFNKYSKLYLKDVTTSALSGTSLTDTQKAFKIESDKTGTPESKIKILADKTSVNDMLDGSYESYIFTKINSGFDKLVFPKTKQANDQWTIPYSKAKDLITYGYSSTTSSSSYEFPEIWFAQHFTK